MSSLTSYKGLQILSPEPTATGGKAINDNFSVIGDTLQTNDANAVQKAANLADLASISIARTNLGLGSAAIHATADFDAAGAAATVNNALTAHTSNTNNPHGTTKDQVGLGNVVNVDTTDASNITNGTFSSARLPTLNYLPLSGGSVTGNVSFGQDVAIDTGNLTVGGSSSFDSGAFTTDGVGNLTANGQFSFQDGNFSSSTDGTGNFLTLASAGTYYQLQCIDTSSEDQWHIGPYWPGDRHPFGFWNAEINQSMLDLRNDGSAQFYFNVAVNGITSLDNGNITTDGNGALTLGGPDAITNGGNQANLILDGNSIAISTNGTNRGSISIDDSELARVNFYNATSFSSIFLADDGTAGIGPYYGNPVIIDGGGNLYVHANIAVDGTTSLDDGAITTDGNGNLNIGSYLSFAGHPSYGIYAEDRGDAYTISIGDQNVNGTGITIDDNAVSVSLRGSMYVSGASTLDGGYIITDGFGNPTFNNSSTITFQNGGTISSPTNDFYFSLQGNSLYIDNYFAGNDDGIVKIGDYQSLGNSTLLTVDDSAAAITLNSRNGFSADGGAIYSDGQGNLTVGTYLSAFYATFNTQTLTPRVITPSSPTEGMIYVDNAHHLKVYLNGAWKTVTVS